MKQIAVCGALIIALGSSGAWAQSPPPGGPGGPGERQGRPERPGGSGLGQAIEEIFFPAELVMRNQLAIGLRDDQQEGIRADMQKSMARFTDLQWQQSAQVQSLEALCKKSPIDEKAALAQFDKLLLSESEVKRLHFASLVRVKNILTPEQQEQLRELEQQDHPRPDGQPRRRDGNQGGAGTQPPGASGR